MKLLLAMFLALYLASCGGPKSPPLPAGATVLVLGDSLTFGTGAGAGEDYPSLLSSRTGWNIVNAGVSSDTTADALERARSSIESSRPQLVLVELGGNDFLRRIPRQETATNLKAILAECRNQAVPAILVAVPQPSVAGAVIGHLSDDPVYREVAKATGTPLIEDVLAATLSQSGLKSDEIHPNAAGYRRIAEGLALELQKLGVLAGH